MLKTSFILQAQVSNHFHNEVQLDILVSKIMEKIYIVLTVVLTICYVSIKWFELEKKFR